jgi:hypothetical protein
VLFGRAQESAVESHLRRLVKDWPPELWAKGGLLRMMPYAVNAQ